MIMAVMVWLFTIAVIFAQMTIKAAVKLTLMACKSIQRAIEARKERC